MMEMYLTYQRFNDVQSIDALAAFLRQHQIDYRIEEASAGGLNDAIVGILAAKDFRLKLKQPDFKKVDGLLQEYYREALGSLPSDYYLYQFTDMELKEIIAKRDEWGVLDFVLAQQLLQQRGVPISEQYIMAMEQQRLAELSQPESTGGSWTILGYGTAFLGSLISFAQLRTSLSPSNNLVHADILGGIIGVFIGYSLMIKKTLPNGERVYAYDAPTRQHGKNILRLSVVLLLAWNICKFYIWYIA
jgi:hypothetical protein